MEYIRVSNKRHEKQNLLQPINKIHEIGSMHDEVHIWIVNRKKEILLFNSDEYQDDNFLWNTMIGHVYYDEIPVQSAVRVIKENFGNYADGLYLEFLFAVDVACNVKNIINNAECFVYLIKPTRDSFFDKISFKCNTKYMKPEDLLDDIKSNPEVYSDTIKPYYPQLNDMLNIKL